jgi:hypothetical protein
MTKIFALFTALAFAAPLAAAAQTVAQDQTSQKVQQTYHTNFSGQAGNR